MIKSDVLKIKEKKEDKGVGFKEDSNQNSYKDEVD